MKPTVFLFIGLVMISTVLGELPPESQRFLTESLSSRRCYDQLSLDSTEMLPQLTHLDFSSLWTTYDEKILGFIGDDYQRLRIKYLAVIKNAENPGKYYVYGKRMVKSDICPFMGEIELIHIRMFSESERAAEYDSWIARDREYAIYRFSRPEYSLFAEYRFFEDPDREGTGFFEGILRSDFFVDSGRVFYDSLDLESDGYRNNQYVGTWTSYADGALEKSNWGEWRIPHPGDLGSENEGSDFWPKRTYWDRGWVTYINAMRVDETGHTAALREEEREWWKE
jgi:hypothetical protein